jgi:hypothetical protein
MLNLVILLIIIIFCFSYIQFGEGGSSSTLSSHQVPNALQEKFTLLRYFAQYMDENLTEGGETAGMRAARRPTAAGRAVTIPQIRRWIRTPKAIIMHLTNGTIQVVILIYINCVDMGRLRG